MLEYAIKTILKNIVNPIKVTPLFTSQIPGVTYKITPISGGPVKESQAEIRIIHNDFDEGLIIKESILKELDMEQSKPSLKANDIVLRSQLAGGGSLFNDGPQAWEITIILIIKWRCL